MRYARLGAGLGLALLFAGSGAPGARQQEGADVTVFASGLNDPRGLAFVVPGLAFPGSVTLGPDGALYVSECAYHCDPGEGRILRVSIR